MTLEQLINAIEAHGYEMAGTLTILPRGIEDAEVHSAPMVLIPSFPPVEKDCVMIPNILLEMDKLRSGLAKIEGAAVITGGTPGTVVRLQFYPKESDDEALSKMRQTGD